MSDLVRVRANGYEFNVGRTTVEKRPDDFDVIEDESAYDRLGHPRPDRRVGGRAMKPKASIDQLAAQKSGRTGAKPRKADLEAEINRRNNTRDADHQIEVGGKGNVADLVAALEADDTKQAAQADNSASESGNPSDEPTTQEN